MTPRLFFALLLPEALRRELVQASETLCRMLPGVPLRPTPFENLHLTFRFFGPEDGVVDRRRITAGLEARLPPMRGGPLELTVSHFSRFPRAGRARIVWAGLSGSGPEGAARLAAIHRATETLAREIGLDPEPRPFVPHATIARLRAPARVAPSVLAAVSGTASGRTFASSEAALLASTLTPDGAVYCPVANFSLARPASSSPFVTRLSPGGSQ